MKFFKNFLKYDIIFNNASNIIFNTFNINVIKNNISIKIEDNFLIINLDNNYNSTINLEIIDLTFVFKDFNNMQQKY